jgi:hypothetical protein
LVLRVSSWKFLLIGTLFLQFSGPLAASAEEAEQKLTALKREAAGQRIMIAGRQRMLAEGMAAKLCLAESGLNPEPHRRELFVMWNIFDWYHSGLRKGNLNLRLSREFDDGVIGAWRDLDLIWGGLKNTYDGYLSGQAAGPGDVETVVLLTGAVTDGATQLVSALRAAYADQMGARGFGNALLIDLYERQRMLGHRIEKNVCMIGRGAASTERLQNLDATLQLFGASLDAFQNGLADVGVPKPPNAEIAEHLARARAHWEKASPLAASAATGQPLELGDLATFNEAMDLFLSEMTNAIVDLLAAKSAS